MVECVPNFSEGRDKSIIEKITDAIEAVEGARLLHTDMGHDANRTVVSFAAKAEVIVEAAFRSIEAASQWIDMKEHHGAHPRMGATDVCPFTPIHNVSMEEAIELSKELGERVAAELDIPVYLYEYSATRPERQRLSSLRKGEYESISKKMELEEWTPDFGRRFVNARSGMTAIGARNLLVAFNVNLDTEDTHVAQSIARRVRETGYRKNDQHFPGLIKGLKAIGWLMPSYGCAQVSMNITDLEAAGIDSVFNAVQEEAQRLGHLVSGSELIGLIPEGTLVDAGKNLCSTAFHDNNVLYYINLIISHLGLDKSSLFVANERILERLL